MWGSWWCDDDDEEEDDDDDGDNDVDDDDDEEEDDDDDDGDNDVDDDDDDHDFVEDEDEVERKMRMWMLRRVGEDDDVEEENQSEDRTAHLVRVCAVETHMDISKEPFCVEIYRKNAGRPGDHLDQTPGLYCYRKNPFSVATPFGEIYDTLG